MYEEYKANRDTLHKTSHFSYHINMQSLDHFTLIHPNFLDIPASLWVVL